MANKEGSKDDGVDTEEESPSLLTKRMFKAARATHDKSNKLIMIKLGLVLTSKPLYVEAVSLFIPIYEHLEIILEQQQKQKHPELSKLSPVLDRLKRASRFRRDVETLLSDRPDKVRELEARRKHGETYAPVELQDYIQYLYKISKEKPILLVAYVYHIYMAIFAGGNIIKGMVQRAFSLKTNDGVQGFCVQDGVDIKELKEELKKILNEQMVISEEDQALLLKEAPQVLVRNNTVVETIQGTAIFASAQRDCLFFLLAIAVAFVAIVVFLWFS